MKKLHENFFQKSYSLEQQWRDIPEWKTYKRETKWRLWRRSGVSLVNFEHVSHFL